MRVGTYNSELHTHFSGKRRRLFTNRSIRIKMAPSVAEIPQHTETAPVKASVKIVPEITETKPKVRRIIDEEGGKTTASVCRLISTSLRTVADVYIVPTLSPRLGSWREIPTSGAFHPC